MNLSKRIVLVFIMITVMWALSSIFSAIATAPASTKSASVFINGQLFSQKAQLSSNKQWTIAAKAFLASLKVTYQYQPQQKKVIANRSNQSFECTIGQSKARVNRKTMALPTPCTMQNGQVYVPLRIVAETFKATVGFESQSNVFIISTSFKVTAKVLRVVDGDTIEIQWQNGKEKIRMIGVDTPETVHPQKGEEPYGREASNFTKQNLQSKSIWIEFDVEQRDRYKRLLAYVFTTEGKFFNATLIENGYAQLSTYPPNVRWVELFRVLQTNARENQRGLWKANLNNEIKPPQSNVSSPSVYNQANGCKNPLIKGNISRSSNKIYHVPGGYYYLSTKAEKMFCNEQAAQKAGFRKSLR